MPDSFNKDRSVLIFATNRLSYLEFAFNCAASILLNNDIAIYIVSNLNESIPARLKENVTMLSSKPGHAELGIGMKLYMNDYLQTEETVFIDSDCICFDSLEPIFNACKGMAVTAAGNIVPAANWCGEEQAETIKREFELDKLIRFNGGLYYMKKSELTTRIFTIAQGIGYKYDDYGFSRINGKWINEEAPISIAMMLHHQLPIADDGQYITDLFTDRRPAQLNVLKEERVLINPPPPSSYHREWYPEKYSPVLLHFGGSNINSYPYNSQHWLLKLHRLKINAGISSAFINLFFHIPYRSFHWLIQSLKK
ncbi:MAG: hypothetical protein EOP47_15505 [Sphingobacteriaceae bacterium]|nr:MAG: hypothetical protein EOP47_15505 [Sphingobacteriaceae bacterium]